MNKLNLFNKSKSQPEKRDVPYTEEERSPLVRTKDLNNGLVKVELFIPGLEPGRDKFHLKKGKIAFDFNNGGRGFDMEAVMKDTKNRVRTKFKYIVQRLPGRIEISESKWEVEKGKIVVMMMKHKEDWNVDWMNILRTRPMVQVEKGIVVVMMAKHENDKNVDWEKAVHERDFGSPPAKKLRFAEGSDDED